MRSYWLDNPLCFFPPQLVDDIDLYAVWLGIFRPNEVREKLGLPRVEDPDADKFWGYERLDPNGGQ